MIVWSTCIYSLWDSRFILWEYAANHSSSASSACRDLFPSNSSTSFCSADFSLVVESITGFLMLFCSDGAFLCKLVVSISTSPTRLNTFPLFRSEICTEIVASSFWNDDVDAGNDFLVLVESTFWLSMDLTRCGIDIDGMLVFVAGSFSYLTDRKNNKIYTKDELSRLLYALCTYIIQKFLSVHFRAKSKNIQWYRFFELLCRDIHIERRGGCKNKNFYNSILFLFCTLPSSYL